MIGAALILLSVGAGDLIRLYVPRRARPYALGAGALALIVLSAGADATVWAFAAVAATTLWMLGTPQRTGGRVGLWPVVLVASLCVLAVALVGARSDQGPLAEVWPTSAPLSALSLDSALLAVGALAFLTESGNVVVRAALRDGAVPEVEPLALKGGRLIGPLERILVFSLTLTGAFTLLAAVLAAKGIVRFPEISRDTENGTRAEYFLIGSLVSWATALGVAFLFWWGGRG